jgi:chorismate dehydratase
LFVSCKFAAKIQHLERKIRVGAVSYLNTKPLLYGLEGAECAKSMDLVTDFPANVAKMLLEDRIDMGLVPVAIIPKLKEWHINTGFCIGATQKVASVGLFSEKPLDQCHQVLLDYQSRTSAALANLLLKNYWQSPATLLNASGEDYRKQIYGDTAGLVIGDRALQQAQVSPHYYDLAEAWINYTQLPFVFAAWISNKPLPEDFIASFHEANAVGMNHLAEIAQQFAVPYYDLHHYYVNNISYQLDEDKKKGLSLFLKMLTQG